MKQFKIILKDICTYILMNTNLIEFKVIDTIHKNMKIT